MTLLGPRARTSTGASEVLLGFGAPVPGDTPTRHEVGGEQIQPTCRREIGNIDFEPLTRQVHRADPGSHGKALLRQRRKTEGGEVSEWIRLPRRLRHPD